MKVLMFGWEFPPFSSGGLGTHCYGLTKALVSRNVSITFVMPGNVSMKGNSLKVIGAGIKKIIVHSDIKPYVPSLDSIKKTRVGEVPKPVYDRDFFSSVRKYNELAFDAVSDEDFDIIHCHDWMTFPVGVRMKHYKNKPLVVTVHSTEFDRTGGLSPNQWIANIEWFGMYHADKVITVSNYMKNQIIERYAVPEEKICVIHNGVDPREFSGERIPSNIGRTVLFLGRVTLQKGPDYFLEAAKLVLEKERDVKFVVVGKGDMLHSMIEKAVSLGISNNVFFTGYQPDITKFYRMADIYVMPSVSEPFGIAALEAMSAGTPIIVSKQSGVSEAVRHRFTADFWDVRDIANKIIGVLEHPPLKKEMSTNGLKEVKYMTWDKTAEKTLSVYKTILQNQ